MVLSEAKHPCLAVDACHEYKDEYLLAELLSKTALASQVNCLATLGLSAQHFELLRSWSYTHRVSLQFRSEERCTYDRFLTREVTDSQVTKHLSSILPRALASRLKTKVTEHRWKFDVIYKLVAVRGTGAEATDRLEFFACDGSHYIETASIMIPHPELKSEAAAFDVDITWLLQHLSLLDESKMSTTFAINRDCEYCRTPRRNIEVDSALRYFSAFDAWSEEVASYLHHLFDIQVESGKVCHNIASMDSHAIFVPVLPILDAQKGVLSTSDAADDAYEPRSDMLAVVLSAGLHGSSVLHAADMNKLLEEEFRSLAAKHDELLKVFPRADALASSVAGKLVTTLTHCADVSRYLHDAMDYLESMLRQQLIAAIGKEVSHTDFAEYFKFHNRKLFSGAYRLVPFCFAVRHSARHSPKGLLSIEEQAGGHVVESIAEPILTHTASCNHELQMQLPISASLNVKFVGERYLHSWLYPQFTKEAAPRLSLNAKTKPFCSMLVLVGRLVSAQVFDPRYGFIVENGEELTIPLDVTTMPSPKEFRDAIESLSPEQQRFAKACRAMQLESTLFAIVVIDIKPQLEKVLNLPADSLTKEVKLTRDLMRLLVKYQVPSDHLSHEEHTTNATGTTNPRDALEAVRGHCRAMYELISEMQECELQQQRQTRAFEQEHQHQGQEKAAATGKERPSPEVKVFSLILYRWKKNGSLQLISCSDMSSFTFFQRLTTFEHFRFFSRTVVDKSVPGRRTLCQIDSSRNCHAWVHPQGVGAALVTDNAAPARSANMLLSEAVEVFLSSMCGQWERASEDLSLVCPEITELFQNGLQSQSFRIQNDLDAILENMQSNIEQVILRADSLDKLVKQSTDLSQPATQFYRTAEKPTRFSRLMSWGTKRNSAPSAAALPAPSNATAASAGLRAPESATAPATSSSAAPEKAASQLEGGASSSRLEVTDQSAGHNGRRPDRAYDVVTSSGDVEWDLTQVPAEMDRSISALDVEGAVRLATITPSDSWTKKSAGLVASPKKSVLGATEQKQERNAAFDLLDVLSMSGALVVNNAHLHVLIAATHSFDKSIMETLVQDSVNPIEKVMRSTLMMASTVHRRPASDLFQDHSATCLDELLA